MSTTSLVVAPLTGTIESVAVSAGDTVSAGDLLLVLESMKVHVQVKAEVDGIVTHLLVVAGENVKRDKVLFEIDTSDDQRPHSPSSTTRPPEQKQHSSLQEFQARQAKTSDEARSEAMLRRHNKGYRTARENLAELCAPESFNEYGQFAVAAQRQRQSYEVLKTSTAADGIITGIGKVNCDLFNSKDSQAAIVVNDYSVLAGTQGFFHHQKLDRILETAAKKNLPVIMFSEGGGGRPGDTDVTTVNSGLQCTSFGTWAGLSGIVPRIAVANGYNFAGNAALFGAADITIATQSSWIGMAGPAMIAGGGLGTFKATEIGPIEIQANNGVVDIVATDETHAAQLAKRTLSFFQGRISDWQQCDQAIMRTLMPENRRVTYSVREIITNLADRNSFQELKPGYGGSIVTGFIRINGSPVGVLANDCAVLGGAIDVTAGEKAAEFMQLCNQFSIPLLSLCDTPGFMVGPEHEESGAVRRLSKLFTAGAQLAVPLIALVLRKCYGLGAQAMLGGSTLKPIYTLAWPTGEFGPMGLEGAVELGFKKELEAVNDDAERQALFDRLLAELYARGQANEVASVLEIDAVIDPADSRQRIVTMLNLE